MIKVKPSMLATILLGIVAGWLFVLLWVQVAFSAAMSFAFNIALLLAVIKGKLR